MDGGDRLLSQQGLIDGGDLLVQRVDVGRLDRHYRIEEERRVDPIGLAGELEGGRVTVERPGPLRGRGGGGYSMFCRRKRA